MQSRSHPWAGALREHAIDSEALTGNPLGDPHARPLLVYTPPAYAAEPERRFPVLYVIQGLTGMVEMWRNRKPFQPNVVELVDALFAEPAVPPAIVAYVDAFTALGGSQFLDSPATGRYHTYLCDEVVDWVDAHYRTLPEAAHRGIAGKSSGGYGAMVTPMLRPDRFGGLATHAGDALFEHAYWPDVREAMRALRDDYDGSYDTFWTDVRARPGRPRSSDGVLLNVWTMAACYSADPDGTVRLPWHPDGTIDHETWDRWLSWDPIRMAPDHGEALRGLRAIWIDGGRSDEFYLDLGAEAFAAAVRDLGIDERVLHVELFDGTHSNLEWRYPLALRFLAERLSPAAT
jgi:S-formylglutathione hydrolase FrmB